MTASLKSAGTMPSNREQLPSLVIEGRRVFKHSLTRKVDHESNKQDFVGDFIMNFYRISQIINNCCVRSCSCRNLLLKI